MLVTRVHLIPATPVDHQNFFPDRRRVCCRVAGLRPRLNMLGALAAARLSQYLIDSQPAYLRERQEPAYAKIIRARAIARRIPGDISAERLLGQAKGGSDIRAGHTGRLQVLDDLVPLPRRSIHLGRPLALFFRVLSLILGTVLSTSGLHLIRRPGTGVAAFFVIAAVGTALTGTRIVARHAT